MSDQSWNVFGHCPACKAGPGEPCRDQRRAPRGGERRIVKRAHRLREQLAVPLAIERDPDVPWRYR